MMTSFQVLVVVVVVAAAAAAAEPLLMKQGLSCHVLVLAAASEVVEVEAS